MCWGFYPTLVFVLAELLVLAVVFWRNQLNDRLNVFLHIPFFGQEVVQLLIWMALSSDAYATPQTCASLNSWLSLLVGVIGCMIPCWLALYAMRAQPSEPQSLLVRGRLRAWAIICGSFATFELDVIVLAQVLETCPRCTVPGPWGHQIWPFLQIRPKALSLMHYPPYIFLIVPSFILAMVGTGTLVPFAFGFIWWHPPLLYLIMGDEWASFWCFGSSLLCFVYLVEPFLLKTLEWEPTPFAHIVDGWFTIPADAVMSLFRMRTEPIDSLASLPDPNRIGCSSIASSPDVDEPEEGSDRMTLIVQ